MKCANHPVSPAVGNCSSCELPLCGVCANFINDTIYCDKCEKSAEAEALVAARQAQREQTRPEGMTQQDQAEAERQEQEEQKKRKFQMTVIGICVLILSGQLALFLINRSDSGEVTLPASSLPAIALPQCLQVFQEIGQIIATGLEPTPTLRCADSAVAPIVRRQGGVLRVSHPNPGAYGLSELFVTSDNPVPQLVE